MDLDDEELDATRKLYGIDKENKVEEDLKNVEFLIRDMKADGYYYNQTFIKSLEHLIKSYKELEAILKQTQNSWFEDTQKIEKQQAELEKKDKQINLMASYIRVDDIETADDIDLCEYLGKSYDKCRCLSDKCEDCIKEYMEKEVKKWDLYI